MLATGSMHRTRSLLRLSPRGYATATPGLKNVVLVDGARIPFQPYGHKDYVDLMAYDLSRLAITGLMNKTGISPSKVDYVTWGTVTQEIRTSNIARDAALGSGMPKNVTGHTVTQACISANQAICTGISNIQTGVSDVVIELTKRPELMKVKKQAATA